MDGSIDFLCLPHFDSPSVFAALVDAERGGRFQIAPALECPVRKQLYLPDTNVLLTRFLDVGGVAELSDFMPAADAAQAHTVVRRAKTVRGEVRFQMRCEPRFDYARAAHTMERRSETEILFHGRAGQAGLVLRNPNRPDPLSGAHLELSGTTAEKVQQLLDQQINPSLAMHGGFAGLDRVEDETVYVTMGGGCQGCAVSAMTLREGIARSIQEAIPEVKEVVDVTDHALGENPFYA
jgi:Fe-S cluster biogenesis protein NfuA